VSERKHFIIIDDDPASNLICEAFLTDVYEDSDVRVFAEPWLGLEHLKNDYSHRDSPRAVLFLDLNMPQMSGWEFLELFGTLDNVIKEKITVYMLSSSIDYKDIARANANRHVVAFVSKPLNRQRILDLQLPA